MQFFSPTQQRLKDNFKGDIYEEDNFYSSYYLPLYGECDGERRLDYSIEYTDGLISKISGDEKIYEFSYDENGRIIAVSTVRKSIAIVKNPSEINYTYSEDGRITQEYISRVNNKTGEAFTTVYDYTNVK